MLVYSRTIETFLKRVRLYARRILTDEFGVHVARTRFHLPNGWSWPLSIVAIDDATRLGYFDSDGYIIGINKSLMYSAKEKVIKDLLRHEIAHYFTYIEFESQGNEVAPHGREFHGICRRFGLGPDVASATIEVRAANDAIEGDLRSEKVITKIRKLLSLSRSDNANEAELATMRANELMVKHNLESVAALESEDADVEFRVRLVIPCRRSSPRIAAIGKILSEFFVWPVHSSRGLEVTGTLENIENAAYVAEFLDRELRSIWRREKRRKPKLREKAFMIALARSYRQKLTDLRTGLTEADQVALVALGEELSWAASGAYGGLGSASAQSYVPCAESSQLGAKAGASLRIHRGVSGSGAVPLIGD